MQPKSPGWVKKRNNPIKVLKYFNSSLSLNKNRGFIKITWATKSSSLGSRLISRGNLWKKNGPLVAYYANRYGPLIIGHGNLRGILRYSEIKLTKRENWEKRAKEAKLAEREKKETEDSME